MKKLDNKGFAIASVLYSIMVLFLILLLSILGILGSRKAILDKNKKDIVESLNSSLDRNKFVFSPRNITIVNTGNTDKIREELMNGVTAIDIDGNVIGSEYIRFNLDISDPNTIENKKYNVVYTANNGGNTITGTRTVTFVGAVVNLSLTTTKTLDFSTFTLSNGATYDSSTRILSQSTNSGTKVYAESDYIEVNENYYNVIVDAFAPTPVPKSEVGGTYWSITFYDKNYNKINRNSGSASVGMSFYGSKDGDWYNDQSWDDVASTQHTAWGGKVNNLKYVKFSFKFNSNWSAYPANFKNLRLVGSSLANDYYDIVISTTSSSEIVLKKYAQGKKDISYFATNGIPTNSNSIRVTSNGIYTVYVKDMNGNEAINYIEITHIS